MKNLFSFKKECPLYIELREGETLFAEGYFRIEEYSLSRILLASDKSFLNIRGDGLVIRHLSENGIAVDGRIDGIDILRHDSADIR